MCASLFKPAIRRSEISLPGDASHVDVAETMELVSMQTPNHEDCCVIDIRALSDNPSESVR